MTKEERAYLQGLTPAQLSNLFHEMSLAEDEYYIEGFGCMNVREFGEWYSNEMFIRLQQKRYRIYA